MFRAVIVAASAVALSSFFFSSQAAAQCVEALPNVTCTGADADGYDAGANDGVDVDVQGGATVDGGANTEAINLNDDSSLTNAGDITLSTNDGVAVQMGENATITNDGNITASGTDGRAIAVGDGADITNNATGVITGGADGASDTGFAVDFTGTDDAATNVLTNAGGTITGGADGAVDGSAGDDQILMQAGSTTTGDINTNGGDDLVRLIGSGASLNGDVNLGDGDDRMDINGMVTAYGGNVDGGEGNNTFVVTGSGAEFTGDYTGGDDVDTIFLFQNTTVDSDNLFDLGAGNDEFNVEGGGTSSFDFEILGAAGDDTVTFEFDAVVTDADVDLGADDDRIVVEDGADVTGTFDLGGGSDTVEIDGDANVADMSGATFTGNIDLGVADDVAGDANTVDIGINATVDGDIDGGAGADTITLEQNAAVTGQISLGDGADAISADDGVDFQDTVDLGDGADQVDIQDGATVTGTTLSLGGGSDFVNLLGDTDVADMSGSTFTGNIDLGVADDLAGALNSLNIRINATLDGDALGGLGDDGINMDQGARITGQVDTGAGVDRLTLGVDATVDGNIDLGDGADEFTFEAGADINGTLDMGDGDDFVDIRDDANLDLGGGTLELGEGSDEVVLFRPIDEALNTGAIITGNVDLGSVGDDGSDENEIRLQRLTTLDGNVVGGAGNDLITMGRESTITGTITLGDGADEMAVSRQSSVQGAVDFGDGDDILTVGPGVSFDSTIDMGPGEDEILISNEATLGANLDLGAGDDLLVFRQSSQIPADLTLGPGSDTLQLTAEDLNSPGAVLTSEVDLSAIQAALGADEFEALIVGPEDDGLPPGVWQLETSGARARFVDGVTFRNGGAVFDGTVEIEGDVVQEFNSDLVFDLGNDVDNGQLDIVGGLTIEPSDLGDEGPDDDQLTRAVVTITGDLDAGDYDLIVTTTGIDRDYEDSEFETPDLLTYSFERALVDGGNTLRLTVLRTPFDLFGRNSSEANLGAYLERGRAASGGAGPFVDFATALNQLDQGDLEKALGQLGAEAYDAHTSSVVSWGRVQQRVLHNRPMHCERFTYSPRPEIVSANPCGPRGIAPWAKVVGDYSSHSSDDDRGYDSIGGGGIVGIDHRLSDRFWWSASAGFGQIEVDHDNDAESEFQSIDLGAMGGAVFGAIQARGSVTYSHGFHQIDRPVDFLGEVLDSKFDSDRVSVAAEASYRARLGPLVLEPGVRGDYTHVNAEAASEKGHDVAALDVDARKSDLYSVAGGIRLSAAVLKYAYVGDWLEWADGVWTPMVSAYWRQDFGDVDRDVTAALDGAPSAAGDFDSEARDSNGGVEVRAGVDFQPLASGVSVGLHYDGYFGDDVTDHSANASVRIPF